MKGLKRYTKSTLTYGESYDLNKKRKAEEEVRKNKEEALHQSYSIEPSFGSSNACDTTTSCDISSSFD